MARTWRGFIAYGEPFVRIAGVSGALAVCLGAYGAHVLRGDENKELYQVFETASRYHYFHTLALLCTPLVGRPRLFGGLMLSGIVLFSGSCYAYALTQNSYFRKVTPLGGILLILGWLSVALM